MDSVKNLFKKYVKPSIVFVCLSPLSNATAKPALRYSCRYNAGGPAATMPRTPQLVDTNASIVTVVGFSLSISAGTTTEVLTTVKITSQIPSRTTGGRTKTTAGKTQYNSGSFQTATKPNACWKGPTTLPTTTFPASKKCGSPEIITNTISTITVTTTRFVPGTGFGLVSTHMACQLLGTSSGGTTPTPRRSCNVRCSKLPGYEDPKPSSSVAYPMSLYNHLIKKTNPLSPNKSLVKKEKKKNSSPVALKESKIRMKQGLKRKKAHLLARISTSLVLKELNKKGQGKHIKKGQALELAMLNEAQRKVLSSYRGLLQETMKKAKRQPHKKHNKHNTAR